MQSWHAYVYINLLTAYNFQCHVFTVHFHMYIKILIDARRGAVFTCAPARIRLGQVRCHSKSVRLKADKYSWKKLQRLTWKYSRLPPDTRGRHWSSLILSAEWPPDVVSFSRNSGLTRRVLRANYKKSKRPCRIIFFHIDRICRRIRARAARVTRVNYLVGVKSRIAIEV